jgi:DNA-binding transcriptional LysR family regulator
MDLDDIALFVRIVELGTLSAAARERNVPVSQVTRALARLEARWGVRLLHRSTHGLSLTDEGDTFLAHARRLGETAEVLRSELSGKLAGPSGWVRLSVSSVVAQSVIAPSLPSLSERHPQLHVDIAADDRIVDMAREGVDIAIRTGEAVGETLVARRIGTLRRRLYASPAYIARHGQPADAGALAQHRLVGSSAHPTLNQWRLADGRAAHEFTVRGHVRADNTAVVLALVQHGVGIGRVITIAADPLVAAGALVPVLPEVSVDAPVPVHAVMLQERHRLPKVRACIDHWAEWLARTAPA